MSGEILVLKDEMQISLDSNAKPTQTQPLYWSDLPICIEHIQPYIIALLPKWVLLGEGGREGGEGGGGGREREKGREGEGGGGREGGCRWVGGLVCEGGRAGRAGGRIGLITGDRVDL